jgi:hypothetical protein
LPNFNKSATIYIYNLNFTDPRVLIDGSVCPATICTEINYSEGALKTLVFNVTQFSTYSAEETPVSTPPGGGGGGSRRVTEFILDKNQLSISLNPGETKKENITITNNGAAAINIQIENLIKDFITIEESSFTINSGESKTLRIEVIAKEDVVPDLYLGKIIIKGGGASKEVFISVEVESRGALLDVRAEIEKKYKKILPGEEILSQIRLFNLGGDGRADVLIEYEIKDYEGNDIVSETESLAIETQSSFIKKIKVPENTKEGMYVFYVKASYNGKVASASDNFEVVSAKKINKEIIYIIITILAIIMGGIIYRFIINRKGRRKFLREKEIIGRSSGNKFRGYKKSFRKKLFR